MVLSFMGCEISTLSEAFSTQVAIKSPSLMNHHLVIFIMIFILEPFPTDFTEKLVDSRVVSFNVSF